MRARADAFQTAIERAPLDISLGILSRAVTDEVPEARTAFYVAGLDIARLHPIRGGDDALESYAPCWSLPIATSDGESIGLFAVYLPEPRDMTADERELVDATTQAAAVIISHYTADRQRADNEVAARQNALLQVEGLVRQRTAERDELRRQLARVEEAERRRLSRELHDQLGQELTAFHLWLEDVARLIRTPASRPRRARDARLVARIEQLQDLAQRMMRGAKYISLELRPPELDDVGFESALDTYVREWSTRYDIAAEVSVTGSDSVRTLSDDIASAFYRIAQEALTNVAKHAQARHVSVIVDRRDREMRMLIEDDGRGFDQEATHRIRRERRHGLAGMRERAALVGGEVEIESGSDGTTVYVRIPLQ
jgi:signal transduction histidine kinase